jgi:hypothetical protein
MQHDDAWPVVPTVSGDLGLTYIKVWCPFSDVARSRLYCTSCHCSCRIQTVLSDHRAVMSQSWVLRGSRYGRVVSPCGKPFRGFHSQALDVSDATGELLTARKDVRADAGPLTAPWALLLRDMVAD